MSLRKRVTLLGRRSDLTPAQFRLHWQVEHGPIATGFSGVERYHQNRVRSPHPLASDPWPVDGIVELWFNASAGPTPGRDPDVTTRLVRDEPRFLQALSGFAVPPCNPYPPVAWKVWVLATCRESSHQDLWPEMALAATACARSLQLLQTHVVGDDEQPFLREALDPFANPPRVFAVFGWPREGSPDGPAAEVRDFLHREASGLLNQVQVLVTDSVTIV